MGIIKRGLLGGFSGRVGNIVGSSWKGIAIIKSLPLSVANPRTAKQIKNRTAFSKTVQMAKPILSEFIKPLWDRFAVRMSGFNAFMRENVRNYNADVHTWLDGLVMSEGKMKEAELAFDGYSSTDNLFTVEVKAVADDAYAQSTDVQVAVLTCLSQFPKMYISQQGTRDVGTAFFNVSADFNPNEAFAAVAFMRQDGTIVSTSHFQDVSDAG